MIAEKKLDGIFMIDEERRKVNLEIRDQTRLFRKGSVDNWGLLGKPDVVDLRY